MPIRRNSEGQRIVEFNIEATINELMGIETTSTNNTFTLFTNNLVEDSFEPLMNYLTANNLNIVEKDMNKQAFSKLILPNTIIYYSYEISSYNKVIKKGFIKTPKLVEDNDFRVYNENGYGDISFDFCNLNKIIGFTNETFGFGSKKTIIKTIEELKAFRVENRVPFALLDNNYYRWIDLIEDDGMILVINDKLELISKTLPNEYRSLFFGLSVRQLNRLQERSNIEERRLSVQRRIEKRKRNEEHEKLAVVELKKIYDFSVEQFNADSTTLDFKKFVMPSTFGFESTWKPDLKIPINDWTYNYENENDDQSYLLDLYKRGIRKWNEQVNHPFIGEISTDPGCIEIPSVVYGKFDASKMIKQFANLKNRFNKELNVLPSSVVDLEEEGGGHVHVSYDYLKKLSPSFFGRFFENLTLFCINNPWFGWSMNNPMDAINAKNPLYTDYKSAIESAKNGDYPSELTHKSYVIKYHSSYDTIEFRLFVMPRTTKELKLHLELVQRIWNYCYILTFEGKKYREVYTQVSQLAKISHDDALTGLQEMCKEIQIDYKKLVKCKKVEDLWKRYFAYGMSKEELLK